MNLPSYRLFVLGAGFSAPAGLPLANGLLEHVREDVRSSFQCSGWDGTLEREIEEWSSLYPGESIDLERVLAYSHRKHYLGLRGSDECFAHGSESIVATRRAIQRILIQATPSDTPKLYRNFAQRLCPRDVVLTFNYDTLLEQALDNVGKQYTLTPECWLETGRGFEPKFVDILKLHGSIDWYDRYYLDDAMRRHTEQGNDVLNRDPIFGPDSTVPSEPLSRGRTEEEFGDNILPRVFRVPDHPTYFPIEEGEAVSRVVPFFLPPAYDKLLGYAPILDLWKNLHRTQDVYSSIVVIGYSMPPYDSYAYEALGQLFVEYQQGGNTNCLEHRRVPIQLITLPDPGQHDLKCFPFLDPAKTLVWNQGFSTDALNWIDWGDGADHSAVT